MASEDRPTTRVIVKPGEAPPRGETDWARVNAMTGEEVLAAALFGPDAQPLAPEELAKIRRVPSFWKPPAHLQIRWWISGSRPSRSSANWTSSSFRVSEDATRSSPTKATHFPGCSAAFVLSQ